MSALSDPQHKRQGLSPPIKNTHHKIGSPELDFDEESINENIPKARAMELIRLREENNELKDKLMQLKNN